jgi:hypothetical protein
MDTASKFAGLALSPSISWPRAPDATPRNGDSVAVPGRRVFHFKQGKALREDVNAAKGGLGGDVSAGLADQDQ